MCIRDRGTTTADADPEPGKANFRQRPLLTVDEVVTPQIGNCTVFARYVEPAFATQVIFTARLTRLYEREDWKAHFSASKQGEPLTLERGVSIPIHPANTQPEASKASKKISSDNLTEAIKKRMAEAATEKLKPTDDMQPTLTDIRKMKWKAEHQRQAAKAQALIEAGEDVTRQE